MIEELKNKIIEYFNKTNEKIYPSQIQEFLNYQYSLKEINETLESLILEKIIRGSLRQGLENNYRFDCTCHRCNRTFNTNIPNSDLCYDCNRSEMVPIENELIPTFKATAMMNAANERIMAAKKEAKERYDNRVIR